MSDDTYVKEVIGPAIARIEASTKENNEEIKGVRIELASLSTRMDEHGCRIHSLEGGDCQKSSHFIVKADVRRIGDETIRAHTRIDNIITEGLDRRKDKVITWRWRIAQVLVACGIMATTMGLVMAAFFHFKGL